MTNTLLLDATPSFILLALAPISCLLVILSRQPPRRTFGFAVLSMGFVVVAVLELISLAEGMDLRASQGIALVMRAAAWIAAVSLCLSAIQTRLYAMTIGMAVIASSLSLVYILRPIPIAVPTVFNALPPVEILAVAVLFPSTDARSTLASSQVAAIISSLLGVTSNHVARIVQAITTVIWLSTLQLAAIAAQDCEQQVKDSKTDLEFSRPSCASKRSEDFTSLRDPFAASPPPTPALPLPLTRPTRPKRTRPRLHHHQAGNTAQPSVKKLTAEPGWKDEAILSQVLLQTLEIDGAPPSPPNSLRRCAPIRSQNPLPSLLGSPAGMSFRSGTTLITPPNSPVRYSVQSPEPVTPPHSPTSSSVDSHLPLIRHDTNSTKSPSSQGCESIRSSMETITPCRISK